MYISAHYLNEDYFSSDLKDYKSCTNKESSNFTQDLAKLFQLFNLKTSLQTKKLAFHRVFLSVYR